jgi:hypothetical protein
MAEWDLHPTLDAQTGWPTSFTAMPRETHLALWSVAADNLRTTSTYAALSVSLHGTGLYERYGERTPAVEAFLASQSALQESLAAMVRADAGERLRVQSLLRCWDALSLELCLGWRPGEHEVPGPDGPVTVSLDEDHATLRPWPLRDDEVELLCEGVTLTERYADEAALHAALEAAPRHALGFRLTRA